MIIVTSLAPNHANGNNQQEAIKSWTDLGECYALNGEKETEQLNGLYESISLIKTDRTMERLIGKPLVNINAIIDFAKDKNEGLLLTNSDIIIHSLPELKENGVTILSRFDYKEIRDDAKLFEAGFDVFYIPNKLLYLFPPSIYALGMAWHDYWFPYRCIINNIPIYSPTGKSAFHKWHETQYNFEEWNWVGEYFRWEFKLNKTWTIPQLATITLERIKSHLIKI